MPSRTEVTNAIVTALTGITAISGSTFYGKHDRGVGTPNVVVWVEDDSINEAMSDMDDEIREMQLVVEIRDEDPTTPDESIDTIAGSIDTAILTTTEIQSLVYYLQHVGTTFEYLNDGGSTCGLATMNYRITYEPSLVNVPEIEITELTVDSTYLYATVASTTPCIFTGKWNKNGGAASVPTVTDTYVNVITLVWDIGDSPISGDTFGITVKGTDANGTNSSTQLGSVVYA